MRSRNSLNLSTMGLLASALALLVSGPVSGSEIGFYWLQPFALLPYFWASRSASRLFCFGGAALLGGIWASPLFFAVIPRSWMLALFFAGATGTIFAILLVLALILARSASARLCAFGGLWGLAASWSESMALPLRPWPLHGEFVLQFPVMWPAVAWVGWPNVEAMILIALGLTWSLIEGRSTSESLSSRSKISWRSGPSWPGPKISWRSWSRHEISCVGLLGVLLVLFASPSPSGLNKVGVASIGVVQANFTWSRLRVVGASPMVRAEVQERLEGLTRQAIQAGGQLIVWRENGVGVALGQIPSLVTHYRGLLARRSRPGFHRYPEPARETGDDLEIIVTGDWRGPQGTRATAWLLGEHGVRAEVQKQIPVPWFENWEHGLSSNESNESIVMETRAGSAGVLQCYDGVHHGLVKRALDFGAEFFLAPTDNASFYTFGIEREQFVSSALLAIESGRALVAIVNRGASRFIDPYALRYGTLVGRNRSAAQVVRVSRVNGTTFAMQGGRLVAGFGLVVVLLGMMAVRSQWKVSKTSYRSRRVFAFVLSVVLCGSCVFAGMAFAGVYHRHVSGRFHPRFLPWSTKEQTFDVVEMGNHRDSAGLFRQREAFRCGPSALAFALFILGDTVFPETLDAENPPGPFSLAELHTLAQSRGIFAQMFHVRPSRLHLSAEQVLLLHLRRDHYVAIFRDHEGKTIQFDPADGSMVAVRLDELDDLASGYGMVLQLEDSPSRDLKSSMNTLLN